MWYINLFYVNVFLNIPESPFQAKKALKEKRFKIFRRAEKYIKEYRTKEKQEIRLIRDAKKQGSVIVPAEAKLAFVIRIRG